jgi:hypothetical protein
MTYDDLTTEQQKHVDSLDQKLVAQAWELEMLPQNFTDSDHLEEGITTFLLSNPVPASVYFEKHPDELEAFNEKAKEARNG